MRTGAERLLVWPCRISQMAENSQTDPLTNTTKPNTNATITVRIIKSFEYRNFKNLVLHNLNLETIKTDELLALCQQRVYISLFGLIHYLVWFASSACLLEISSAPGWKMLQNVALGKHKPLAIVSSLWLMKILPSDTFKLYSKAHGAKVESSCYPNWEYHCSSTSL
jgi:hypothetical protein